MTFISKSIIVEDSITYNGRSLINYLTRTIYVSVIPVGDQYATVALALASITDNSSNIRYVIKCGAGNHTIAAVNLAAKPYVNVVGESINATVFNVTAGGHGFIIGTMNEISFCTIQNSPAGFSAISIVSCGDFAQIHKISFLDCSIGITLSNTVIDSYFYGEYIDFSGTMVSAIVASNTSGTLTINLENCYVLPLNTAVTCYTMSGTGLQFDLNVSGNRGVAQTGVGVLYFNGASVNVFSTYFENFATAISNTNSGSASVGRFVACQTKGNITAISIIQTTSTGSFSGMMDNPTITIATGAVFGISYLEAVLGNKKEIYFDSASFNLVAGITPTTSAATRATLTATGYSLITFPGTGGTAFGASINFRIPKDYLRNGRFKLIYTSATNANNIRWQFILSTKPLGGDLATTSVTGLGTTEVANTQYQIGESAFIDTPTVLLGDTVSIRVYRDPAHASDTAGVDAYIQGLVFEYESHK